MLGRGGDIGMKPLRVLVICNEDPEHILGGMGMHVRELYRTLAQRDIRIDLLTDGAGDGSEPYLGFTKWYGDKHTCWKPRTAGLACLFTTELLMVKTLMRMIADGHRWDVIHMHEWGSVQLGRMARHALDIPLVGTMHLCISYLAQLDNPDGWYPSEPADHYMMQQEGNLLCDPDEAILCSNAYVELARRWLLINRPIHTIHNGICTREWNPDTGCAAVARVGLADRPMALQVGRIAEMKGIVPLLDAIEQHDTGWQVVLVGEVNANTSKDREDWIVTKRIRALEAAHPERLRWVGFQHGVDLRNLYAAADCVLMPSTHEPFGIVALEAMAMGCPLITTEVDGLKEVVCDDEGGEYAMIIPSRSPGAIVEALRVLEAPAVRTELRELGLRRVRDFTWDKAADETLAVYHKAVRNYASRTTYSR